MFEIIKPGTKIDFMKRRKLAYLFSGVVMFIGVVSLVLHGGPNYGIDFAGGTLVQIRFTGSVAIDEIRSALKQGGIEDAAVQGFEAEGKGEYLVRLPATGADPEGISAAVRAALAQRFGAEGFEIRRVEMVGPKVGKDLRSKGLLATIFAMLGMLIYISLRFDLRFGVGAVVAVLHDVIVTIGILSLLDIEFSIPVLAAILTIVGYSINDTIVVYDRIRENMPKMKREPFERMLNITVNETLSRTILTGMSTLMVLFVLFFMGGGVIHDFTFTLIVGIILGTYSSVYIASATVLEWETIYPKKVK